jgi:hypothetical protein
MTLKKVGRFELARRSCGAAEGDRSCARRTSATSRSLTLAYSEANSTSTRSQSTGLSDRPADCGEHLGEVDELRPALKRFIAEANSTNIA